MKHVLCVPDDWEDAWGPAIKAVKADSDFKKHYGEYRKLCDKLGSHEELPHKSLMSTLKAIFDVWSRFTAGDISPKTPDEVVCYKFPGLSKEDQRKNILHILEVNPDKGALCSGTEIPRLTVDGEHAASFFRARRS